MKYLKNEDGSIILKWDEENNTGVFTEIEMGIENNSYGITIQQEVIEKAPSEMIEIESSEYMAIRNGKMLDYWNETAA